VICPWTIYRCFGDLEILDKHYDGMRRWVDSLQISSKEGIRSYPGYDGFAGFGDWLSTNAETPIDLIGTAFYAFSARLLSQAAATLGRAEDAETYAQLAEEEKTAFQKRYVTHDGLVASGSQTSYVLALHFDLLPKEARPKALENLVRDIERRGYHLSTGFVGTPYINHVLSEGGRLDVAYKLLEQQSWPSWLYSVTQGATTIWERWDGWTHDKGFQDAGMNSFNHYAYGAIGDWLYSVVAGVDLDPVVPGYKRSILQPRPGGGLTHAGVNLRTQYGPLLSSWRIADHRFRWEVRVPANTSARAILPPEVSEGHVDGAPVSGVTELIAGFYEFEGNWEA
jgi:alpha-L-rhamnosidase